MYLPPHFREQRLEALHNLIRSAPLGLLVTAEGGLAANHVPFRLHPEGGSAGLGCLRAHIARANDHARIAGAVEALVVFQGVDHYISPSWYATKALTGKVVPTWNYVAVHVTGRLRIVDDADFLAAQIRDLTDAHEQSRAEPWAVSDAPDTFIAQQMRAIVGLEIDILKLEGKWKLSQNRNAEDRSGVVAGLGREADAAAQAMAPLIPEG